MKIIISPAKKLNTNLSSLEKKMKFQFINEAIDLINILKEKSISDVKELMSISDNLAKLNWQRFQDWDTLNYKTYEAIFLFQGDVYQGMRAENFSDEELKFAQNNLRIISGLYGLLKPLDRILPYRLEMATKILNSKGDNLYEFWGDKLYKSLLHDLGKEEYIINLASNEYSNAMCLSDFTNNILTPVFKDYKNGKLKVISFYAKKARGEMCNFIIKNKIESVEDLKLFNSNGYNYQEQKNGNILFVR